MTKKKTCNEDCFNCIYDDCILPAYKIKAVFSPEELKTRKAAYNHKYQEKQKLKKEAKPRENQQNPNP